MCYLSVKRGACVNIENVMQTFVPPQPITDFPTYECLDWWVSCFFLFVAVCEEGWCCDPRTTDLWFSTCRFWFLFLSFLKLLIYRCIKSIFVFSSSCKFDEVCIKFYIGYPIWALLKLFSVLVIESSPLLYFQI